MRNAFADEITQIASTDPRVVLLSGDIGNRLFDRLRAQSPSQFINCGVAEANMMGVAAGMGLCGLRPVVYTITPFTTTRCLEQIRVDVAYHESPVMIVGTGSGLSYASLGPTHHSLEDFAIFRAIPNLRILAPWDAVSLRRLIRETLEDRVPTYIRIGKKGERDLLSPDLVAKLGGLTEAQTGDAACILAVGTVASEAVAAAEVLAGKGISCTVRLAHTVKPFDEMVVRALLAKHKLVVTVEEHSVVGGFGESIASFAQKVRYSGRVLTLGVPDAFLSKSGSQHYARKIVGIDADAIVRAVQGSVN